MHRSRPGFGCLGWQQEVRTVEAGLQYDWALQAQAYDDGALDALGGRGSACQEWRSWEFFP